jgi:hypothetical protein
MPIAALTDDKPKLFLFTTFVFPVTIAVLDIYLLWVCPLNEFILHLILISASDLFPCAYHVSLKVQRAPIFICPDADLNEIVRTLWKLHRISIGMPVAFNAAFCRDPAKMRPPHADLGEIKFVFDIFDIIGRFAVALDFSLVG